MNDTNSQELRILIENAFKKADKKRMLSNELKELISYTENSRSWGGFIFRLMREGIIIKDSEKPIRSGANKFYYYRLIEKPVSAGEIIVAKDEFVVFNDKTMKFQRATGEDELNKVIKELLEKEGQRLMIFTLNEFVELEPTRKKAVN